MFYRNIQWMQGRKPYFKAVHNGLYDDISISISENGLFSRFLVNGFLEKCDVVGLVCPFGICPPPGVRGGVRGVCEVSIPYALMQTRPKDSVLSPRVTLHRQYRAPRCTRRRVDVGLVLWSERCCGRDLPSKRPQVYSTGSTHVVRRFACRSVESGGRVSQQ